MKPFGYPKPEKLKHKNDIALLFEKGKWCSSGNLRIITHQPEHLAIQKIGVSVSKRYFKKAVYRNRIKRLLRECYRLNKPAFVEAFGGNTISMLFWTSAELPKHYNDVEKNFLKLCQKYKERNV